MVGGTSNLSNRVQITLQSTYSLICMRHLKLVRKRESKTREKQKGKGREGRGNESNNDIERQSEIERDIQRQAFETS